MRGAGRGFGDYVMLSFRETKDGERKTNRWDEPNFGRSSLVPPEAA
jgi:hypothetical protein